MATTLNPTPIDFFSMSQELVCFRIGEEAEPFYIHRDLLAAHGFDFDFDNLGVQPHLDNDGWYLWHLDILPCIFRGFLHWLYRQELPTEEMIVSSEHPSAWDDVVTEIPLACTMALVLWFFGHGFGIASLQRDTMTFLFDHYRVQREGPHANFVHWCFLGSEAHGFEDSDLQRLCVDLYAKWYGHNASSKDFWDLYDKLQELDRKFVDQVFERRDVIIADRETGEPSGVLHLKQYCCHDTTATGCRCQRSDDTNLIE